MSNQPHIVILGAGFGGLYAAREFCGKPVRVTIIDRSNHHLFQPLLYQVATAGLSPGDIAQPVRSILRKCKNVETLLAEASAIDTGAKKVILTTGEIAYDYLVVATGATHAYFGHEEWGAIAPGLKTLEDAIAIRRMFLTAFEEAETEPDTARRAALLSFVIIGAGPTGVELAGTMAEMAKRTLSGDFRRINPAGAKVLLLEGGPRVLASYPEKLSAAAERQLRTLGVEVRTSSRVTRVESHAVYIGEECIPTERVFWAAGVSASPLGRTLNAELDRAGRVKVQPDLSVTDHPEVFVIGDLAACTDAHGAQVPGVAPAAMQMARHAARTILARVANRPAPPPFTYNDKGSLATIGRAAAVAVFGKRQISGLPAWLAWLFIHIYFLIGFRNRLFVIMQWAWSYVGLQPGARLITYYAAGSRVQTVRDGSGPTAIGAKRGV